MKRLVSMILAIMLMLSWATTAYAAAPEDNGVFNEFTTAVSDTISGADIDTTARATDYDLAICKSSADLDSKFPLKEWRGEGHCTLTPVELFDTVTWDITLNVQLYKDGNYCTRKNGTSLQSDGYDLATKWVEGDSRDQFGVHVRCTVIDDNGEKIWDKIHTVGNPFE